MRIAILGAGFSGLAAAWQLIELHSKNSDLEITLFDPKEIGTGTSGIAAGLVHPYAGLHANQNWRAYEGLLETNNLLLAAQKYSNKTVAHYTGLLRIAITPQQKESFYKSFQRYPDLEWWDAEKCQSKVPGLAQEPGLYITSAITVHTSTYLQGLFKACQEKGLKFSQTNIPALEHLDHFDRVIVTMGADSQVLYNMAMTPVKGQILELAWPEDLPPLPFSINSQAYIVMSPDKKSCYAGATFEKGFSSPEPDIDTAIKEIMPKVEALFPPLAKKNIIGCRAGIRAATPNHLPLLKQINPKCWLLCGMGSKGLLYHALFAKELAENVINEKIL